MINLVKGDTFNLGFVIKYPITNWKIRCEIFDNSTHSIKLATANSGGSDSEIIILHAANGKFQIIGTAGLTDDFDELSKIEIELEDPDGNKYTLYQDQVLFSQEQIDWITPTP